MTKVLIIEDEAPIRANLQRILTLEGFAVLEAADGAAGLAVAQSAKPDIILCDVMMPGLDGYGVLEGLRAHPDTAGIPLIFVSASADAADLEAGLSRGAANYLTKPFTIRDVLDVLQAELGKDRSS